MKTNNEANSVYFSSLAINFKFRLFKFSIYILK